MHIDTPMRREIQHIRGQNLAIRHNDNKFRLRLLEQVGNRPIFQRLRLMNR